MVLLVVLGAALPALLANAHSQAGSGLLSPRSLSLVQPAAPVQPTAAIAAPAAPKEDGETYGPAPEDSKDDKEGSPCDAQPESVPGDDQQCANADDDTKGREQCKTTYHCLVAPENPMETFQADVGAVENGGDENLKKVYQACPDGFQKLDKCIEFIRCRKVKEVRECGEQSYNKNKFFKNRVELLSKCLRSMLNHKEALITGYIEDTKGINSKVSDELDKVLTQAEGLAAPKGGGEEVQGQGDDGGAGGGEEGPGEEGAPGASSLRQGEIDGLTRVHDKDALIMQHAIRNLEKGLQALARRMSGASTEGASPGSPGSPEAAPKLEDCAAAIQSLEETPGNFENAAQPEGGLLETQAEYFADDESVEALRRAEGRLRGQ